MPCCFENTLHYSSPGHGDWGVVRIGMLAPESIQLFVCPMACGRHGAIGAINQGLKDKLFYLYLSQSDIVQGYDDLIPDAVDNVLDAIDVQPKVIFIFVSCLDDLIGTDHEALLDTLHEAHKGIQFRICHMNPISLDSKTPPPVSMQNNMFSLLEKSNIRDNGINSIGNLEKIADTSEIYDFMKAYGADVFRHISDYKTFDTYQQMAQSRINVVIGPAARQAAGQMKAKLNIPFMFMPVTYDMDEISENYKKLKEILFPDAEENFDFTEHKKKAEQSIKKALEVVGDMPIIIDASATIQPFGMAKALLKYGFNVERVEAQECLAFDKEHMKWINENYPDMEIYQPQHHTSVLYNRRKPHSLSIGFEGAYFAGSDYATDMFNDGGMYGYDAICRLMHLMTEAMKKKIDLEALINGYGLVV